MVLLDMCCPYGAILKAADHSQIQFLNDMDFFAAAKLPQLFSDYLQACFITLMQEDTVSYVFKCFIFVNIQPRNEKEHNKLF